MFGTGARVYSNVGLETDVLNADPHRLILILFDGALTCMQRGRAAMAAGEGAQKIRHLSKAIQIVDEGLKVAVDPTVDPAFAGRLISLYHFVEMRLLQANLRNDVRALDEAAKIIGQLRDAWAQIGPISAAAASSARAALNARTRPTGAAPATVASGRRSLQAYQV